MSEVSIEKIIETISDIDAESEAVSDVDSESESVSALDAESDITHFCDNIEESNLDDLISNIHELMEEYLNSEILKISKPDFHKEMVEDITHIVFQNLLDVNICKDSDYISIFEIVNDQCHIKYNPNFPLRSMKHCNYNYHCHEYGLDKEFVLSQLQNKIHHLRRLNEAAPKQRTPEWYQRRYNMMTASNLWQALNTEAQRNRLIYEKCKPLDFGYTENKWVNTDNSLHWGVKYEPLTVLVYEKLTGAKIEEFGCIQHDKYSFLGASPDGIVTNADSPLFGRMLEIKNIYNRHMDGIPSEAYWIQIQMQLECCNLDVCDFVETRFKEYSCETEFFEEDDETVLRGVILHCIPKDGKSNVPLYKYMPLNISLNQKDIDDWISVCKNELPEHAIYTKIYWYLDDIQMSTIERHTMWFESALPILKETWETIEHERATGYEHRAAKKRIVTDVIVVNSNDGSESHIIKNMPSTNSGICLIKIDSDEK
jgi:putative phage-type endonuclease